MDQYELRTQGVSPRGYRPTSIVGRVTYNGTPFARRPSLAFWQSKGGSVVSLLAQHKLRDAYTFGLATDEEKADAATARGTGVTWVLARLSQSNVDEKEAPWRSLPRLDFLVKGKGPAAPDGVEGFLLDGNPAKAAYWVLTERMGVAPGLIDDVWKHSVEICDEPFTASAVSPNTAPTSDEVRRFRVNPSFARVINEIAEAQNPAIDTTTSAGRAQAITLWKQARLERVVERYTGLDFANVDDDTKADVVAAWNRRFTGSPTDEDGERPRYRANGVISSDADPRQVLEQLAQSMAGSIEEHGGIWYVRAGSLSQRAAFIVTDDDIVDDTVRQQLEPPVKDQPTEVRARLIQNERLEFERFVMEPVQRVDANIGEIDATNRPTFIREANPQGTLVRDMGDLVYVTDPLQADELMRIALYRTRWNTRTIYLTVKPNKDFSFYAISRGAPVLVNSKSEDIMGERVGERTDSMRCVVVQTPRYDEAGNIELVLQQQDEEVFGEKFGLVLDYNDAGDVILVPPPTPPPTPPTCTRIARTARPGESFTGSEMQVLGSGGTGRLTYALQWTSGDPGLVIDSTTGYVTGTLPASTVQTYEGLATVTDSKGLTGSCSVVVATSNLGEAPAIVLTGVAEGVPPNGSDTWTAVVDYPSVLSPDYVGTTPEEWSFEMASTSSDSFSISSSGAGTTAIDSGARVGSQRLGTVLASHPRGFVLEARSSRGLFLSRPAT